MNVYFITTNDQKAKEAQRIFRRLGGTKRFGISLCRVRESVPELLDASIRAIVRAKTIEAYKRLGLPCVVEHGGLYLDALPGLLGGIGQIVWDNIGDRMCDFLRSKDDRAATAKSVIGYCDGKRISIFGGKVKGRVARSASGKRGHRWDPIFIPEGSNRTYGQMKSEKRLKKSPESRAWKKFLTSEFLGRDGTTVIRDMGHERHSS